MTTSNGITWLDLSHQYIAAKLNLATGSYKVPDVLSAINQTELVLGTCGQYSNGATNTSNTSSGIVTEKYAQKLSAYLLYYNDDLIGHGVNETPFSTFTYSGSVSPQNYDQQPQSSVLLYIVLPVIVIIVVVSLIYIGVRIRRIGQSFARKRTIIEKYNTEI